MELVVLLGNKKSIPTTVTFVEGGIKPKPEANAV